MAAIVTAGSSTISIQPLDSKIDGFLCDAKVVSFASPININGDVQNGYDSCNDIVINAKVIETCKDILVTVFTVRAWFKFIVVNLKLF